MKKVKLFCKTTLVLATMLLLGTGNVWGYSDGQDITNLQTSWTKSKADYQAGRERYETYNYTAEEGKIMYMSISGLESVGYYEVQFYAAANSTSGRGFTNIYGDNIAQWYVNDQAFDLSVINQTDCTLESDAYIRKAVVYVSDGKLEFGLKNIATGGNWYVAKVKSIKYQGAYPSALWTWRGETYSNPSDNFYVYNAGKDMWLGHEETTPKTYADVSKSDVYSCAEYKYSYWSGKKSLYTNISGTTYYLKSVNGTSSLATATDNDNTNMEWSSEGSAFSNSYKVVPKGQNRYMEASDDGISNVSFSKNENKKSGNYNTWLYVSGNQMSAYKEYIAAFNNFVSYIANNSLPAGYVAVINAVLTSNSSADKNNATTHISNLTSAKTVAEGVHSAYANALVTVADVKNILDNAAPSDAKNALQNAYNEYSVAIENAASQKAVEDADAALKDARATYYASAKKIPNFVANFTQEAANALLVEDAIENAFSLTDVDGETYTFIPEGVVAYDKATNTLTALAAGTTTLTISQPATSTIEAGRADFSFIVSKHDVVWAWNAENVAYIYNTTIDNIFTLSAGNLANITISTSTNENVAKLVNGNLVIGKVAGTAQFTVTAVADNKWNAKEETFTVTPGHVANHVPYVPTEDLFNNSIIKSIQNISFDNNQQITLGVTGSFNYGDKHIIIPISGIPDKLHIGFDAGGLCTGDDWYVYESETDDFTGKPSLVSGIGNSNTSRDITLNHNTRYIKIGNGKNGDSYIKNLSITELKTLSADTPEAIMTKLGDTESASADVVLTYANARLTINASVAGEGFSINKTSVEGGIDVYGEETFVVSFDPTGKAAGEHSATVTFTDGDMRKEVVVTAHVLVPLSLVAMNNENETIYYYATFSSADYAVEFSEDVEVYTVTVSGDQMTLHPVNGNQVPANNGVLIKSQSNNIWYKYISSAADLSDNMLQPGTGELTEGDNCRFYRLAYYDYEAKTGLGFYYGPNCNDGQAFKCKVGTAYLAVPKTTAEAPARFLLDRQDISTDLLNVNVNDNQGKKVMMNGVLYIIRDGKTYDSFGRMVK